MSSNGFKLSYRIDNTSDSSIWVKVKGGLSYEVTRPEKPSVYKEQNIEVKLLNVDIAMLSLNIDDALTPLDKEIIQNMIVWLEEEKKRMLGTYSGNRAFTTTIKLTAQHTVENDVIHSEMLGITLFASANRSNKHARNTPQAALDKLEDTEYKDNSLTTSIQLVDPDNRYGSLWVNLLGRAIKLETQRTLNAVPGLYIISNIDGNTYLKKYFGFNDINEKLLEEYGIFTTKREAELQGGNTEKIIKLEKQAVENKKSIQVYADDAIRQIGKIAQLEIKLANHASSIGRLKESYTIKEATQKSEFNMLKLKSQHDGFGSTVKNISAVLGLGLTVYKLMC